MSSPEVLPSYKKSPVTEVILATQFQRISRWTSAHVGLLWNEFRADFPQVADQPRHEPAQEVFETKREPTLRFDLEPVRGARTWFISKDGERLLQLQSDWCAYNWRKISEDGQYPRYEQVRERFSTFLTTLENFVSSEGLGKVAPVQCELTYINHVVHEDPKRTHAELDRVLTVLRREYSENYLPDLEEASINLSYVMRSASGHPEGRLHIAVQPALRTGDDSPVYVMRVTARGRPATGDIAGALKCLDEAHRWAVLGFTAVTTPEMHKRWERS